MKNIALRSFVLNIYYNNNIPIDAARSIQK